MRKTIDIWSRMLLPSRGDFSPDLARYLIKLKAPPSLQRKADRLARRSNEGKLSPQEVVEYEALLEVENVLILLKAKAHKSLSRKRKVA